jgi:flagellar M-ring protein FliF
MDFLQNINAVWQKIGVVQRAMLVGIVMACVITGGLLTKWATKPDMQLLFGGVAPEEASKMVDKISEADIPYQLRSGGRSIYVPREHVNRLRLTLAKEGLPQGGQDGYKIFDNEKIGVSPLVQQINLNRAIQDELAKTIQMIDCVTFARVHIVRPEESMFTTAPKKATASVILRLKPGWNISPDKVVAVTNLVAGAIDGLSSQDVTVVNSQGILLTSQGGGSGIVTSANTFMDYKTRVEQIQAAKVSEMLEMVLGPGRSNVKVSAVVDMTSIQTETIEYTKGVSREETVTSTTTSTEPPVDADGVKTGTSDTTADETVENKFDNPVTKTIRVDVPGKIISLSVSAVVDLNKPLPPLPAPEEGAEPVEDTRTPEKIMTVENVKELIRNALGKDLLGADDSALSVVDVSFQRPVMVSDDEAASYDKMARYIEIARQSSMGVLAICALIVLKIFTGGGKKKGGGGEGLEALGEGSPIAMLPASGDAAAFKQHIAKSLQKNPEQVRQLFAAWLAEGS